MSNFMWVRKNTFFVTTLIILACLICVLIGEMTLRVFTPHWLAAWMKEAGFRGKFKVEGYEYNYVANIDEMGGRATRFAEGNKNVAIIPFVGDSMSFGLGVKDDETYITLLSAKLKKRCLNLSASGSNLSHQLNIIELRHKELGSPLFYVFNFFTGNDILDYDSELSSDGKHKPNSLKLFNFLHYINNNFYSMPLFKKSYVMQFIKSKLLIFYNKITNSQTINPIFKTMNKDNGLYVKRKVARGLEIELQRLVRLSKELHFKPIFIIIPDRHQVYPGLIELKARYYGLNIESIDAELPNKIIERRLSVRNIPYISVLEDLKKKGDGLYYIHDGHLTAAGHKAVAECVYLPLKKLISDISDTPVVR